jgi:hypothetical protein
MSYKNVNYLQIRQGVRYRRVRVRRRCIFQCSQRTRRNDILHRIVPVEYVHTTYNTIKYK